MNQLLCATTSFLRPATKGWKTEPFPAMARFSEGKSTFVTGCQHLDQSWVRTRHLLRNVWVDKVTILVTFAWFTSPGRPVRFRGISFVWTISGRGGAVSSHTDASVAPEDKAEGTEFRTPGASEFPGDVSQFPYKTLRILSHPAALSIQRFQKHEIAERILDAGSIASATLIFIWAIPATRWPVSVIFPFVQDRMVERPTQHSPQSGLIQNASKIASVKVASTIPRLSGRERVVIAIFAGHVPAISTTFGIWTAVIFAISVVRLPAIEPTFARKEAAISARTSPSRSAIQCVCNWWATKRLISPTSLVAAFELKARDATARVPAVNLNIKVNKKKTDVSTSWMYLVDWKENSPQGAFLQLMWNNK